MKISIVLVAVALVVGYLILPIIIWAFARNSKLGKWLTFGMLLVFLVVLFFGITSEIGFTKEYATIKVNFTSRWFSKKINWSLSGIQKVDFLINIFMLIPIGLFAIYISRKTFMQKLLTCLLVGLMCGVLLETIQFVLPVVRSVQLSDVLLNAISVVIGGVMGVVYDKIFNKKHLK